MKTLGILSISLILIFFSCKKDSFITSPDANVTISIDTIKFDTVFTSTGSVTAGFKIINENDQRLRISSVKLFGGSTSAFRINADGFTGPQVNGLEVNANDSLYVFVSVTVDPTIADLPFVIRDSIEVSYNGANRLVQLEAWGQNAHFFRDKVISGSETWDNDLPYVVLGSLYITPFSSLTINKGCRIYVHADAPIVVDGTLVVNGEKDTVDRVSFQGDRLDQPYKDFPASWPGIFFRTASNNSLLNYTIIRNAYQAIALLDPSPNANPKVTLNQCIIDNAYDAGIISINSSVNAQNCLISNCGKNLVLAKGGNYNFTHCTVASISNSYIFHRDPVLYLSNYIKVNNNPVTADLNAVFRNCIFWGENGTTEDEVVVEKSGATIFNVNFDYNLWKVKTDPDGVTKNQIIANQNPEFDSLNTSKKIYDFHLKDISPALNKGTNAGILLDLDGNPRPMGLPDLGCYERQ